MTSTTYTAVRQNGKITVTASDGTPVKKGTVGGARAERASVVLVGQYLPGTPVEMMGCRQDAEAGKAEAHRLANDTTMRHRGQNIPVTPHVFCVAVPVVDAEAVTAAQEGQTFNGVGADKVGPKCKTNHGTWFCNTHRKGFTNNLQKDIHIGNGKHELVWLCFEHGPEEP